MMSSFEYVSVLISIILGLGVTQIVTGFADIVQNWQRVKLYWPHLLWILLVFFLHIQEWWAVYDLRHFDAWQLPVFLFIILYPINLFILARLLYPSFQDNPAIDFKKFYFDNYRRFFLLVIILSLLAIADNSFISRLGLEGIVLPLIILSALTLVTLNKWEMEWLHKLIVILLFAAMVISLLSQLNITGLMPIR